METQTIITVSRPTIDINATIAKGQPVYTGTKTTTITANCSVTPALVESAIIDNERKWDWVASAANYSNIVVPQNPIFIDTITKIADMVKDSMTMNQIAEFYYDESELGKRFRAAVENIVHLEVKCDFYGGEEIDENGEFHTTDMATTIHKEIKSQYLVVRHALIERIKQIK